jgi:hypothetical protein
VPQDIATAVRNKERRDDGETAALIRRGVAAAAVKTGGGMNRTFVEAIAHNGQGAPIRTAAGTIPAHASPPAQATTGSALSFFPTESSPASMQLASATSTSSIAGLLGNRSGPKEPERTVFVGKPKPSVSSVTGATARTEPAGKAANAGTSRPSASPPKQAADSEPQNVPAAKPNLLNGAAPALPTGGFSTRFGGPG